MHPLLLQATELDLAEVVLATMTGGVFGSRGVAPRCAVEVFGGHRLPLLHPTEAIPLDALIGVFTDGGAVTLTYGVASVTGARLPLAIPLCAGARPPTVLRHDRTTRVWAVYEVYGATQRAALAAYSERPGEGLRVDPFPPSSSSSHERSSAV